MARPAKTKRAGFRPDGTPLSGPEVIEAIAAEHDTILIAFSRGKDSLAAWLSVRDHFKRVIPFHMYGVPGLKFVDEYLDYCEEFFGTHIMRVPHPSLYRQLNAAMWQPQERLAVLEAAGLPNFDYDTLTDLIKSELGLDHGLYTASGVRAADSPLRRSAMTQYGPINVKRRYFYPVWDMYKDELVKLLTESGIRLPIDYEWFGRSFDGIDYRFIHKIRDNAPEDFQTILAWFPLCELEIMRYESMGDNLP